MEQTLYVMMLTLALNNGVGRLGAANPRPVLTHILMKTVKHITGRQSYTVLHSFQQNNYD